VDVKVDEVAVPARIRGSLGHRSMLPESPAARAHISVPVVDGPQSATDSRLPVSIPGVVVPLAGLATTLDLALRENLVADPGEPFPSNVWCLRDKAQVSRQVC